MSFSLLPIDRQECLASSGHSSSSFFQRSEGDNDLSQRLSLAQAIIAMDPLSAKDCGTDQEKLSRLIPLEPKNDRNRVANIIEEIRAAGRFSLWFVRQPIQRQNRWLDAYNAISLGVDDCYSKRVEEADWLLVSCLQRILIENTPFDSQIAEAIDLVFNVKFCPRAVMSKLSEDQLPIFLSKLPREVKYLTIDGTGCGGGVLSSSLIRAFLNLHQLSLVGVNHIADLSGNETIEELKVSGSTCSLPVDCRALESIKIEEHKQSIDFSPITTYPKLKKLSIVQDNHAEVIELPPNQIKDLSLSKCSKVKKLEVNSSKLAKLSIFQCPELEDVIVNQWIGKENINNGYPLPFNVILRETGEILYRKSYSLADCDSFFP